MLPMAKEWIRGVEKDWSGVKGSACVYESCVIGVKNGWKCRVIRNNNRGVGTEWGNVNGAGECEGSGVMGTEWMNGNRVDEWEQGG